MHNMSKKSCIQPCSPQDCEKPNVSHAFINKSKTIPQNGLLRMRSSDTSPTSETFLTEPRKSYTKIDNQNYANILENFESEKFGYYLTNEPIWYDWYIYFGLGLGLLLFSLFCVKWIIDVFTGAKPVQISNFGYS